MSSTGHSAAPKAGLAGSLLAHAAKQRWKRLKGAVSGINRAILMAREDRAQFEVEAKEVRMADSGKHQDLGQDEEGEAQVTWLQ